MAIDASIPLQVRPVQLPDPMEGYGRLLALKNLARQNQTGDLQLREQELQLQEQQQDMQDRQKANQILEQAGGNVEKALPMMVGKVSPKMYQDFQKSHLDTRKALAELDDKKLTITKYQNEQLAGLTGQAIALPDDQYAAQWPTLRAAALQINPELQLPEQPFPREQLGAFRTTFMTNDAYLKEEERRRLAAKEQRDQQEFDATLPGKVADATQKQLGVAAQTVPDNQADWTRWRNGLNAPIAAQLPAMFSPAAAEKARQMGMTAAEQGTAEHQKVVDEDLRKPKPGTDVPFSRPVEAQKVRIAQESRPVVNNVVPGLGSGQNQPGQGGQVTGDEYLKKLPAGTAAQVRAIAEGRAVLPSAATRSQAAIELRNAVFQYDPSYSDQRAQVRRAFTSGSDGKNIGALNTATVHLDQLGEAAKALGNGSFRPGNETWNAMRSMFGASAPTNFESIKSAVAGEMANALKGNATDPEIANIAKSIQGANSANQLADVVTTNLHVLGAKLQTYRERYQQQIPGDTVWSPVLPSARAVYDKHKVGATAPQGKPPLSSFERR